MRSLRLILGDQLSFCLPSLQNIAPQDVVCFFEVHAEATYVPHHPKKIAFLFAAMRHFAQELQAAGHQVHYVKLDDPHNTQSFTREIERAIDLFKADQIIVTEAGEYRVQEFFKQWQQDFDIPLSILPDIRFLASHDDFHHWAKGKKQLRMEFFYRAMRQKYTILLDEKRQPVGGQWNYDKENRHPPKGKMVFPKRPIHAYSPILQEVLTLVAKKFSHHFGDLLPFDLPITRQQALTDLAFFCDYLLPHFGTYQDAMLAGEAYLYHSNLSTALNSGLLLPLEVCLAAQKTYEDGKADLPAVEGFIRQILGWREYIRGIYWHHMPAYAKMNHLGATRPLPSFYWTGNTQMNCMKTAIMHTKKHAYSHHIQRLMVTGNFALITGLDVFAVQEWYLSVYTDAYEWVEMPNTAGMALYADGGIVASKPYASSGKYIDKMSNFCKNCTYNVQKTLEQDACPFNSLYWHFIDRHQTEWQKNQRMPFVLATWQKMGADKQNAYLKKAEQILENLDHL